MAHEFTVEVVKEGDAHRVRVTAPVIPTMFGYGVAPALLATEARELAKAITVAADHATRANNPPKKFYQ